MRCLTPAEVSSWLATHELPADPYNQPDTASRHYHQCELLKEYPPIRFFIRGLLAEIGNAGPLLILPTDWSAYQPDEMIAIDAIRRLSGETRPLIEAPGHLLDPADTETAVALFSLFTTYQWTCWVHSPADRSVLLSWEGEFLDFWTESTGKLAAMQQLAATHGFTVPPLPPS